MQDFREHNTDTKVHFELTLSEENMAIALSEGLVKKFKLTTTISTSNMHLFDSKGIIKKYDTPEQGMTHSACLLFLIISTVAFPVGIVDMGVNICLWDPSHKGPQLEFHLHDNNSSNLIRRPDIGVSLWYLAVLEEFYDIRLELYVKRKVQYITFFNTEV